MRGSEKFFLYEKRIAGLLGQNADLAVFFGGESWLPYSFINIKTHRNLLV